MTEINKSHLISSFTLPTLVVHLMESPYGVFFDKVTLVGQIDKFKI